jgi:hypothetical protein
MVALLEKTDYTFKTAHRARGATSTPVAPVQLRSKSANCIEFRRNTYDNRRRLESCSRDPIGYNDGKNLYRTYFVNYLVDPAGTTAISTSSELICPQPCDSAKKCKFNAKLSSECKDKKEIYRLNLSYSPKPPTQLGELEFRPCGPVGCYGGLNRAPGGKL